MERKTIGRQRRPKLAPRRSRHHPAAAAWHTSGRQRTERTFAHQFGRHCCALKSSSHQQQIPHYNDDNTSLMQSPSKATTAPAAMNDAHYTIDWLIDWLDFMSLSTQYKLYGRRFYRAKDLTNSVKVLKEKATKENIGNANNKIHIYIQNNTH